MRAEVKEESEFQAGHTQSPIKTMHTSKSKLKSVMTGEFNYLRQRNAVLETASVRQIAAMKAEQEAISHQLSVSRAECQAAACPPTDDSALMQALASRVEPAPGPSEPSTLAQAFR